MASWVGPDVKCCPECLGPVERKRHSNNSIRFHCLDDGCVVSHVERKYDNKKKHYEDRVVFCVVAV